MVFHIIIKKICGGQKMDKKKEKERKPILIGCYNKSVILTYVGLAASLNGMITLITADMSGSMDYLGLAILCLVIAGVCDMFDGTIARKCKRTEEEKLFGIQLDSLVDTVSFLAFPVVILYYIAGNNPITYIISLLYVINGIIRLAWFNIKTEENKGIYQGLPVTMSAAIIPLVYLITKEIDMNSLTAIMYDTYLIIAVLFTLNFKLKKPKGKFQIAMVCGAVLFLAWFLFF